MKRKREGGRKEEGGKEEWLLEATTRVPCIQTIKITHQVCQPLRNQCDYVLGPVGVFHQQDIHYLVGHHCALLL